MLAAQPVVAISGPTEVTIGGNATLTLTFDNQPDASPGSDVGYAPYLDLVLPRNGADGAGPTSDAPFQNDGIRFLSASYLGQALTSTVLEFDVNGEAIHPFARDASGELRVVRAADYGLGPGDELVVLTLPFGSFTPGQTPQQISVTLSVSSFADVGVALPISAVGGFAFGRDALNNPTVDAPVLGPVAAATITPTLVSISKSFSGADGETATGPNFLRSYTLSLDVATGQTLTDLVLTDRLPDGIVVTGAAIASGPPGTISLDPATNALTVTFAGPVLGGPGADVVVRVDFHVGQTLAPGAPETPVLDPGTGAQRPLANDLSATASWTPLDPRDLPTTVTVDLPGPENVFVARALAVQKSVAVVGGGPPEPFDTLRWTLSAQVSDYFSFAGLVLSDTLTDGQRLDAASPALTVREGGALIYAGAFDPANVTIVENADGTTSVSFRVADELAFRGLDPELAGGRVGDPAGPTTLAVTFASQVSRFYADGRPLLQGDALGNTVGIAGTLPGSGSVVVDSGSAGAALARGFGLAKSIHLVNGEAPSVAIPPVTNTDTITFRLQYTLPTGSANNFTLTDFLPLPILRVIGDAGPLTFLDIRNDGSDPATLPPPGTAWWHPDETFDLASPVGYGGMPTLVLDSASNSVTFDFGSFYMEVPQPLKVDILFRLPIEDRPFGDNLFLTNLVTSREANTAGAVVTSNAIAQFVLTQPALNVTKGVIGVETGQGFFPVSFDPAPAGPVAFSPPGTAGAPFSGTITSAMLAAAPIDSNLSGVDAGDLVRFAIVVENTGRGIRGAHDILIRDTLPAGFEVPPGGLNLTVPRGDGVAIPFVLRGGGLFDPGGGLELLDPTDLDSTDLRGALTRLTTEGEPGSPPTAPTGKNLALIVYDLRVADTAWATGLAMTNTAEIAFYAAVEGGGDFAVNLLPEDRLDSATVVTGDPIAGKVLVSTSLTESVDPFVLIGEEALFRVVVSLREGLTRDLALADILPATPGVLTLRDWTLVSVGSNIAFTGAAPPIGVAQTGPIIIPLGDTTNLADNVYDAGDQIVFEVRAAVLDLPQNNRGDLLVNTASVTFTDAAGLTRSVVGTDSVTIIEPGPLIDKRADRTTADGGDTVTYTLTVTNPVVGEVSAPLFDLNIRDIFNDPDLSLVVGSVALGGSAAGRASILIGNGPTDQSIRVFIARLDPGETLVITYQGRISDMVESGRAVLNTAIAQGDSAPGDVPGQRSYSVQDTETVRIAAPALSKIVFSTSLADTGSGQGNPTRPDLAFGEEVTFRLTARFAEGTTFNATLTDLLPLGLVLEARSASILSVGANITAPGAVVGAPGLIGDRNGNGFDDTVTFVLGDVFNRPDGVVNDADVIVFEVTARLRGDLGAAAGVVLTNSGSLAFRSEGFDRAVTAQAAIETVLPRLVIEKLADRLTADGGDIVTYTVRLRDLEGSFSAPAYDITLSDLFEDPDLTLVPGSVTVSGVPATILEGNGSGDSVIRVAIDRILPGQTLTLTYQARIEDSVIAGSRADNVARFESDTHPGIRPGEVVLTGADAETVRIGVPQLAKEVFETSLPETGSGQFAPGRPDVAIGETVVFRLTVTLPEATNILLRLVDQMPTAPGAMEYLSYQILPLPETTNLTFVPGTEIATVADTNGDGLADRLAIDFGTVTNKPDNVIDENDQIVLLLTGRVVDVPGNVSGRVLVNTAQTFLDTLPQAPATAAVDVVEPLLVVDKAASPATGDAGDRITYSVVVAPAAGMTGPAYGVRLTDLLAPDMALVAGTVATTAGTVVAGNNAGDEVVIVALPTLLPGGSAITITFDAVLKDSIEPQQAIDNRADLAYRSAPSFQRDYAASDTARIVVAMDPSVAKGVVVTSLAETSFAFFDPAAPDVAIGEIISYRIVATIGEGTQTLVLRDLLPPLGNLQVIDARVDAIGANISGGALAVGDPGVVAGNTVTFDFGTVVNAGDNVTDSRDQVAVVIRAQVADIPANVAGLQLRNDGDVAVGAPSDPLVRILRADRAVVDVVEPVLLLDKTEQGGFARPGETITYTLTLRHAPGSTAPAYDLVIADTLADGNLSLVPGTVTTTAGTVIAGNAAGDTTIAVALESHPVGEVVTVSFTAEVAASAPAAGTVLNTGTARFDTSPGPGGRPGTVADDAAVPLAPGFAKSIVSTSIGQTAGDSVAVGERITYELVATLPQGTIGDLVIADLLPPGLVPLSATVVSIGSGVTGSALAPGASGTISGQSVRFDFGAVANGSGPAIGSEDQVSVRIVAEVADIAFVTEGVVLANAARLDYTIRGESGGEDAVIAVVVVEPKIAIAKTVDRLAGDAGDLFTYTVTLTPGGSGPAFDVVVTDVLDPVLVPVSASASAGTATIAGQAITLTLPLLLPTDSPVVLTYTVRFTDTVEPGQIVANGATVSWQSSPGPVSRPGSGSDSVIVAGAFPIALEKAIIATSLAETGSDLFDPARPDLAIGEVVTYRLVATLGEGTQRVVIADTLPEGLVPETAAITAVGAGLPPGLVGTPGAIAGQSVTFDLGVLVTAGNNDSADDTITIEVMARVADLPSNQAGTLLVNDSRLTVTAPTAPDNPRGTLVAGAVAGADVVAPLLAIDKSADRAFAILGEPVTYTLVLAHAPGSTAPAFNVVLGDTLAGTALSLVAGSVTTSFGTIESGNGGGDTAVRVTASVLPLGQSIVVTFQAVPVAVPAPAGEAPNTAEFAAASAPSGPPGFVRPFSGSDTTVVIVNGGFADGFPFARLDALERFLSEALPVPRPVP